LGFSPDFSLKIRIDSWLKPNSAVFLIPSLKAGVKAYFLRRKADNSVNLFQISMISNSKRQTLGFEIFEI
jgi:hypothetical protein